MSSSFYHYICIYVQVTCAAHTPAKPLLILLGTPILIAFESVAIAPVGHLVCSNRFCIFSCITFRKIRVAYADAVSHMHDLFVRNKLVLFHVTYSSRTVPI